jgi:plastocyanin
MTASISVANNSFSPTSVVMQSGGTVTWTWSPGAFNHNVTYTGGPTPRPQDSARSLNSPATFSSTISVVGTYTYTCTNHAGMSGTVTVVH